MCSIKDIGHPPRNIWKFRWTMIRVLGIKIKSLDSTTLGQTSWNDIGRKMSPKVRDLSESSGAWSQWVLRCLISESVSILTATNNFSFMTRTSARWCSFFYSFICLFIFVFASSFSPMYRLLTMTTAKRILKKLSLPDWVSKLTFATQLSTVNQFWLYHEW